MTATTKTATSKPAPPAQAVAADAHWSAKMARLRDRQLAETVFAICDDPDVRTRYQRAQRTLDLAQSYAKEHPDEPDAAVDATRAAVELDEAKTAYDQIAIPLTFRALPRRAYEELLKAHLPSDTESDEGREWDEAFPAELIAAASVDGMTATEAQELLDTWSLSEANAMFNAAFNIQHTTRADLGKG
ncbi:hypothetical protein [Streptomyces sp. NBC_00847]|uniref:hypothetical protein n=1 Tax=Streptomyces sp. NBC_00847 TaxID=2975850 RepID=UPI00225E3E5A|nr:hypothetical protein [Streptomyces sp. NBC_00847]MCX4885861.1 hypothetical protein [Streptomyces sp. NBC_00847]